MNGYLLVRSNQLEYGLPLDDVVEVTDDVDVIALSGLGSAVRGIVQHRLGVLPVVHLNAILRASLPSAAFSRTLVVAKCAGTLVAFEVDDAYEVVREAGLPVPPGRNLPWAVGIADRGGSLVPIVDVGVVGDRLRRLEPTAMSHAD